MTEEQIDPDYDNETIHTTFIWLIGTLDKLHPDLLTDQYRMTVDGREAYQELLADEWLPPPEPAQGMLQVIVGHDVAKKVWPQLLAICCNVSFEQGERDGLFQRTIVDGQELWSLTEKGKMQLE